MNTYKGYAKAGFLLLLLVAFVAGCGSDHNDAALSSAKAITAYSINGATGIIDETATPKTIAVTLPFGSSKTGLIAEFTTTGTGVTIGAVAQTSGAMPANDFTYPVTYTVAAADGSSTTYRVTVTVASNSAKSITAYSVAGQVSSTITGTAIAVVMPFGTNKTGLVATFSTSGSGVTVLGATQISGATPNDFTGPVLYTVTAADNTTATYTVTVTNALSSAKAITAYSIASQTSSTILGSAITVTMPFSTPSVTGLVATFSTTGASVMVGTTVQTSGTTSNDFTSPVTYTVTAANGTTATYTVTVNVLTAGNPTAPNLGEAGRFVILAYAAVTGDAACAISNGDIGLTPIARTFITGFTPNGSTGNFVELTNGTSFAPEDSNPLPFPYPLHYATPVVGAEWTSTGDMLTQAATDLGIANSFLAADPNPSAATQVCPTELGLQVLTPGVYKTASNVGITTGALQLDALGDPNAVWIFSIDGSLTTGAPGGSISFVGGVGQAKNVYWRTGGDTVIGANTTFLGSVFAWTQVNVLANANVTGSLFAVTDRVTLISDIVTKAP
jgi:hypothetical protein